MPQAVQAPARPWVQLRSVHRPDLLDCTSTTFVGRTVHSHPLFPIALPQLSQGALSKSPWKEPRRQSARRLPPVGGRSTPTPACPRPRLQPVHRIQIPVHGYHTTTGPPYIRPCKGGLCASPGTYDRPSSHTMPESRLRSFRANVIPHSGSTRAPSCSRTALVGARPGTDCTGPDSAFSHDAG